mgnify:CR=1 FL=1
MYGRKKKNARRRKSQYQASLYLSCPFYTSDAADDTPFLDTGRRRIIKKNNKSAIKRYLNVTHIYLTLATIKTYDQPHSLNTPKHNQ